ncbi:hypothetical protein BX616_006570 [Lobosporangium transversale]|uniref:Uncharacterized protein n=1 Tax=Lobosporangium transversale TaxID=64571 RepID=A0A1Y2GK73_9FUNG|nr:hypothetical protein BCR41DRAFT_371460 [Lobosporangium transversale]KAF9915246.1 hypothetical protein BX616_006570 [Lobosporangium transversale]ORZ13315.1 hypothetical protein BCR41DRAFT_371460 [Lobosporangium transversale]|eukprot:XP_021880396.1 hypothetical protein BCR41DRAFT_371460 [Lobosporangium transversale]
MASENRSLLEMLQGQGQGQQCQPGQPAHGQGQGQGQSQGQVHGPQQQPTAELPSSAQSQSYYHNIGPPIGQMMPGYGFGQQSMDPHQMYLHQIMQHGQRGPPISQFQSGPSFQSRPSSQGQSLASLLQSLNQPTAVSPTNTSTPTFSTAQAHTPSQTDEATNSLKLALFGPPKQEPTIAQQKTEDIKLALFGGPRTDSSQAQPSPKKEEISASTATVTATAPIITPAVAQFSPGSPSQTRTSTPIAGSQDNISVGPLPKRPSFSNPAPRREELDTGIHPHDDQKRYQLDQLLPPHSAWNHRVQKLAKGSSGIPDGVYLSHPGSGVTTYDTGLDNSEAIFSEDLETIPITLIPTDVEYYHGKMVAASKGYISYAAKGGKIRVIEQSLGHRTLLRGHTDQVIDMGFSLANAKDSGAQLLASVAKDSRLIIWELSGSDHDATDIIYSKCLELIGEPQSNQPRYSHIAWSPVKSSQLALVNNDDHSVLIIDISNLVQSQEGSSPVLTEAQLWTHATVIQAHDQAINDISFSRDGSVLVTASEDGSVKFWDINAPSENALLNEFVPHGGLGVTNAIFVDQTDATTSRCVVTACRRGTELSLWWVGGTGPLDQFIFKEPPSSTRRTSVGKAAQRLQEMRMFNFVGYDYETSSLVLANSVRLSLFGLKVKVTSTSEAEMPSNNVDQAAYIRASAAAEAAPCTATFDFMIEYPMPQHIVSFVVMPDSSLEYNGFSVYCIQTKAVQQYIIKGLEPHDKHKCQTFISAPPSVKSTEPKVRSTSKTSTPKSSHSPSGKTNEGSESTGSFKADKAVVDSNVIAASIAAAETQEKEPEKTIKLHGAVINGAIAKLKEKKRNSTADTQLPAESSEKKDPTKSGASGRGGRKTSQDMTTSVSAADGANNKKGQASIDIKPVSETTRPSGRNSRQASHRHQEAAEGPSTAEQSSITAMSAGHVTVSINELQSMFQSMEDKITARFEKKLTAELELQHRKMDQDQIARQEVVLKMISQTLAKNTEQLLVQTVHKEIQNSVVPSLNKIVGAAVERQLSRNINDAMIKTLPTAVEASVNQNIHHIMESSTFFSNLSNQVATSIRPCIEESFKDSFTKVLIPSYQKATQAMFQQIHAAFQAGIEDLASTSKKDHDSIETLTTNVNKIASTVEGIQSRLFNLVQVAQAQPDQFSSNINTGTGGGYQRHDQQRRNNISGLQRTLQGDDIMGGADGGLGPRRASQQASPVETKQSVTINQLIALGEFEKAFTEALSTDDANLVFQTCSKVSPRAVFQPTSVNPNGTLSQPVLLALTHYLANEQLSQDLSTKLTWLQEILRRLDPKDPKLGPPMAKILPIVQMRLEETYGKIMSSGDSSPHLHSLQLLLRVVNNMNP